MIISRGRRYIFVHIPKTGGTSMTLALEARAMADDILIGDTPKAARRRKRLKSLNPEGRLWKHSKMSDIAGIVSPEEMADYFVFTVVRNPWDRLVSYYHWLRAQRFDHTSVGLARSLNFTSFLNHPHTIAALERDTAAAYTTGPDGRDHGDLCIRLEHLETDIFPLERHLGFSLLPLPVANRSDRPGGHRAAYSDADAALVARLFARDIERFGYSF